MVATTKIIHKISKEKLENIIGSSKNISENELVIKEGTYIADLINKNGQISFGIFANPDIYNRALGFIESKPVAYIQNPRIKTARYCKSPIMINEKIVEQIKNTDKSYDTYEIDIIGQSIPLREFLTLHHPYFK